LAVDYLHPSITMVGSRWRKGTTWPATGQKKGRYDTHDLCYLFSQAISPKRVGCKVGKILVDLMDERHVAYYYCYYYYDDDDDDDDETWWLCWTEHKT